MHHGQAKARSLRTDGCFVKTCNHHDRAVAAALKRLRRSLQHGRFRTVTQRQHCLAAPHAGCLARSENNAPYAALFQKRGRHGRL